MIVTARMLLVCALTTLACSPAAAPPEPKTPDTPVSALTVTPAASSGGSVAEAPPVATATGEEQVPDIEYVPTPQNVVDKLLDAAKLTKSDVVYDLGCGDGRIVINAAKRFGVKATGFDIDPKRVAESRANVKSNGVEHLVTIEQKDIFTVDLSPASVVTLYLLPELNVRLIPQLEKLRPGSRIVSHDFDMEGVEPEQTWTVIARDHQTPKNREHYVYLWKAPLQKTAKVAPAPQAAKSAPAAPGAKPAKK